MGDSFTNRGFKILWVVVAYLLSAKLGLEFAHYHPSVSPFWPPSGVGLVALLMFSRNLWPGVTLGAFFANLILTDVGFFPSLGIALGNTLEAIYGAILITRFAEWNKICDRARDFVRFVAAGPIASTALSALIGPVVLCLFGKAAWTNLHSLAFTWWLGDCVGQLVTVPLLLTLRDLRPKNLKLNWEKTLYLSALVFVCGLMFLDWFRGIVPTYLTRSYFIIPILVWAAMRFERFEVAFTLALVVFFATWGTSRGMGVFVEPVGNDSLIRLQTFLGIAIVTISLLGISLRDQRRMNDELLTEIEARRKTEALALESENRFRELAENIREIFYITNLRTPEVMYVSKGYEDIWGKSCESFYEDPMSFLEQVHAEDKPQVLASIEKQLRGEVSSCEYRITRPDGQERWILDRGYPVKNRLGVVERVTGVAEDITERKQVEEQLKIQTAQLLRTNSDLEYFASTASHDLKAPLRMVSSYVRLLADRYKGKLDADADQFIDFALDGSRRMSRLIDDLLEFSRAGWRPAPLQNSDLMSAVERVMRDLRQVIEETGTKITVDSLPTVFVNTSQVELVFQNLISNAIKYRRPGVSPEIKISATASGVSWIFAVADNGQGIATGDSKRIFKIFQRLHAQQEVAGSGIGLATCQRVMERIGGKIWVDSEPGKGSTFYFTIPRIVQGESTPAPEPSSYHEAKLPPTSQFEILSVEDSRADAKLIAELLSANGIQVNLNAVTDGAEAVEYLFRRGPYGTAKTPDIILLDLNLPKKDGSQVLKEVKGHPDLKRIPVLVLSGSDREEDIVRSYEFGANCFITKPGSLAQFDDVVKAVKSFWFKTATLPPAPRRNVS